MSAIAVLVTGSRRMKDWMVMRRSLAKYPEGTVLIHGAAPGADLMADEVGVLLKFVVIPMPAQWDALGTRAGTKRNEDMLEVLLALKRCGYSVYGEAFPAVDSRGTRHMMTLLEKAGVQLAVHEV